jgi:hypothetical protein
VSGTNLGFDFLKVVLPALIAATAALMGVWLGGRTAAQTARRTWEWDAKRDGYVRLLQAAHQLAFQGGLVVMAVNGRADAHVLDAEQERFRSDFAALNGAAAVARLTASPEGKAAITDLIHYLQDVNRFLHEGLPDPVSWIHSITPTLLAELHALEAAVSSDLERRQSSVGRSAPSLEAKRAEVAHAASSQISAGRGNETNGR